ncbi:sugar transferase [Chloroflexota bacterium]
MLKRTFDVVFSLTTLVVTAPLFILIALWIRADSTGPVFYRGVRGGLHGKPFWIFKFRTMVANADQIGGPSTADDDPRVTKAGRFLRKYKLDELPQLISVLRGEMSLVGPRPEVLQEVKFYSEEESALLTVRPGITDYASIVFSNEGEILVGSEDPHQAYREKIQPEKIRLGLEYVRDRSLWVDLKILGRTFLVIFGSRSRPRQ